jgi:dTMP kinase
MEKNQRGLFIVLDGIDGTGKSTQIKLIEQYLYSVNQLCYITAEPSKGEIGQLLRKYLKDPSVPPEVDALLFAADRMDHCYREITPHLQKGEIVISDRYRDSTIIYQSIESKSHKVPQSWLVSLNKYVLVPDLTIILDMDPRVALSRRQQANAESKVELEKFENLQFQLEVRKGFLERAGNPENGRYALIDASKSEKEVFEEIIKEIKQIMETESAF